MANLLLWKNLGGGRWKVMHYMIMELKYFLLLHKVDVKVGSV